MTKDADASAETGADTATSEGGVFESGVPITCLTTLPRVTPVDAGLAETSCLFELSPPLPEGDVTSAVLVDGVALPSSEYEVHGHDVLELTGAACEDYRNGKISNVVVMVACHAP